MSACVLCAGACAGAFAQATPVSVEFQVNTYFTNNQLDPAVAAVGNGGFVVVWQGSGGQDGIGSGVFARRYSSTGAPLDGEFQVNTYTTNDQLRPSVAADDDGDFVIAWHSGHDGSGYGIFARRFSSAGVPLAIEFQVNTYTTDEQRYAAVAVRTGGDFVVTWQSDGQDGSDYGVFARRFDASGVPQAMEFQVSVYTSVRQSDSAVAMSAAGPFVVVWESLQDASGEGVFARRFDANGAPLAADFQVNSYTMSSQSDPKVAIDGDGDFTVAWDSFNQSSVFARRFDASGAPVTSEFQVNYSAGLSRENPAVAIDGDGDFVIAWHNDGQDGWGDGVFARRFDVSGTPEGAEFQVNSHTEEGQDEAAVATDAGGDFVVTWVSRFQDGSFAGIFAQRFAVPKVFDIDANGAADALTDGLLFLRYLFGFRSATLINGAVAGNCTRCIPSPVETYLGGLVALAQAKPAGTEFQVNSYTGGYQLGPTLAADGDGDFVVAWHSAHEGSSYGVIGRRFSSSGAPVASEFQINAHVTGTQAYAAAAVDLDGDFVVVWQSENQDGSGYGVFARRFSSVGVPQAAEFQVNSYTGDDQADPAVAMNSAGAFVVAWHSDGQDGSDIGRGIFARRFDAAGTAQAVELQVNSYTVDDQATPALAIDGSGAFVVAWQSRGQDGSYTGVFARRFNATGQPQAAEFRVNTFTTLHQDAPAVDVDGAGGFVVAWQSLGQDGSNTGVFARRFDAAGIAQAGEFQANTYATSYQFRPAVAVEAGGDFVVSWTSLTQDGSARGVFARRFNASGVAQALEFQVNAYVTGSQAAQTMAMESAGDFVVAWGSQQDGSEYGIFARRFAVARAADIDGNGAADALTDGLLLLRYLFGFRGATLITGAVAGNCTRCTAPAIESYIAAKV